MKLAAPAKAFFAALAPALVAAVLLPATAGATSYLLPPTGTQALQSGWSVTPSSSSPDAALAKGVSQPAAPDTSSYLSAGDSGSWVAVSLAAPPSFSSNETLKQTTAWAYVSTGPSRPLTLSLWTGNPLMGFTILGSTTIPAGQPAGWYSVTTRTPLDPIKLSQLAVAFQAVGSSGASLVYAAYGEVDTLAQAPIQPPQPAPSTPAESTRPLSDVSVRTAAVTVTSTQKDVPVDLSCAAATTGGCHGVLVLRVLSGAAIASVSAAGGPHAVAARCARGCRVLGKQSFNIAAGHTKRVKVHLAHSARHLLQGHKRVTAQAVTVTTDSAGNSQITKTDVTLSHANSGPIAPPSPGPNVSQPTSNSLP